ncbi:LptA/OstA family protein [Pontiella agarivorans]|uniref:LptA/OstA family protein n=1 Tax=Pontiella agarivorans TaxID=3038953 RepID=A0ABU5N145_9BACT|nr:LptA/OstA family protein [Pontiella agarivorans]MDZ8120076.1 LptA/OstA family protein [Pontiella agarivorans]
MIRDFLVFAALLLLVSCSPSSDTKMDESQWADIEAIAADAETVPDPGRMPESRVPTSGPAVGEEFAPFFQRLEAMKAVEREAGETLLSGRGLTLDYDLRSIMLNERVVVQDDEGRLTADALIGRFSVSNTVEFIEAEGRVTLVSSNRTATADHVIYNHHSGFVKLEGRASVAQAGNRLSGERIQLWVRDDRRMICEPNALLEISGDSALELEGVEGGAELDTEIRSDRAVYDEAQGVAELVGNVRVRDPRAAMNCDRVRLFLKDEHEIDWIEAVGGVIIQSDDRRALAGRALYHADEGKFTLEDEPKVKQGLNVMTGDRILFWHENRRLLCEPNARVLLYLDEETKAKFLKDLDE